MSARRCLRRQLFSWIAEYPIVIVLAILCRPDLRNASWTQNLLVGALFVIAAAIVVVPAVVYYYGLDSKTILLVPRRTAGAGTGGIAAAQSAGVCGFHHPDFHGLALL